MSAKLIVGLDGNASGDRALSHAKRLAKLMNNCEIKLVYIIEWSPYSFHTPNELEERSARREQEIDLAMDRVITPALKSLKKDGFKATGVVRHGHVADLLNACAVEENADQVIVGRSSDAGLAARIFGSATANLVMTSSVPVTVVG